MVRHIKCDLFEANTDFLLHQVNCQGVMGSGVAAQVRKKYPKVYNQYKMYCWAFEDDLLGRAQFVDTQKEYKTKFSGIYNLFSQGSFGYDGGIYTNYDALKTALEKVKDDVLCFHRAFKQTDTLTIALPYLLGCCRGGGDWDTVYSIIEKIFANCEEIDVLICECDKG